MMWGHTRIIALLLAGGCGVEGGLGTTEQDIIGGTTAHTATYQTVVGLEASQGNWFCAGVLIDKDWVLTTASCFYQSTLGTNFKVRFDSDNLNNGGGHTIGVSELHFDPGFVDNGWAHDLALIKLATSATDRAATPIARDPMPLGTMVTRLGYGDTQNNSNNGGPLHMIATATADCGAIGDSSISGAMELCFNATSVAECAGDGGDPGFVTVGGKLSVAGVASGGTGQSCNQGYDLHTAVAAELAFIDAYVPKVTTTTPPDPTDPGTPTQPTPLPDPTAPGGADASPAIAGCNAGGNSGSLALVALALAVTVRARRRRA